MGSQLCPNTQRINFTFETIVESKHSCIEKLTHHSPPSPEPQILKKQEPLSEENNIEGQQKEIEDFEVEQVLVLPQGVKFRGKLKDGVPHGIGEEIHNNGDRFIGEFINGFKKEGTYEFCNGEMYIGTFQEGMMSGKGKFYFTNGDTYQGDFVANLRCGKGLYTPRQPTRLGVKYFEGQYLNGQRQGEGTMYFEDGNQITGYWRNGIYEGRFSQ